MDIEAFSEKNFAPVNWINSTFKNAELKSDKEAFVSSLVSKLQLYVQQVNSALEDTSQQILSGLPRVMKDAHNLQNQMCLLKLKMTEVQKGISEVQSETGECMANLERLDSLKSKLQAAKQGLQESDGWGRQVTELEDLFERNDLVKICEKLGSLQKSLLAQCGLPGENERESQVEGFKNRLEALASPAVVQSFSACDTEQTQKFVGIFKNMERLPQLLQYYRTVQKSSLQQHWSEVVDLSENSNCFLHDFYEFLFENYQKQTKWCTNVFGEKGSHEPLIVLAEILPSLQPQREVVILSSLKRSNEKLEVLEDFSKANVHFGNLLLKHFQTGGMPLPHTLEALSRAVFEYFNTFIAQYPAIEQNYLASNLANLNLIQQTAAETIRALGNTNKKIIQWSKDALQRCEKISQNCAITPLSIVLNSIIRTFLEKYKKAQQQLSASKNIEQNWSLLQSCISLLQNLGDFKIALDEFERNFAKKILNTYEKLEENNEYNFGYKLIEKRDINELKKFALKIKSNHQIGSNADDVCHGVFSCVLDQIKPISEETHDTTLAAIFAPVEKHLAVVEPPESLHAASDDVDLPDYSFAPQEFITQIGQYLLTLPQHLEPLLLSPAPSLKYALEICDERYSQSIPSADVLLSLVVEEFCAMYTSQVMQIKSLSLTKSKQLATDIEYIGSVLEELGLTITVQLQQMATLLRAPPEKYLSLSSGCEPRLVTAIRQMRNIISTE